MHQDVTAEDIHMVEHVLSQRREDFPDADDISDFDRLGGTQKLLLGEADRDEIQRAIEAEDGLCN